jgi:hypothetical protein
VITFGDTAKLTGSSLVNLGYRQLSLEKPKLYIVVTIVWRLALAWSFDFLDYTIGWTNWCSV